MTPAEVGPDDVAPVEVEQVEVEQVETVKWLDESEARAWRSFQRMQMRLLARLARDLGAHSGLSYQDYAVLVALTDQPGGGVRLFQLGHELGWEKSRISHQVTRMAQRGLVEKQICRSDRRGAVVVVTQAGRDEITAAAPSHLRAVRRLVIDRLTPAQLDSLADLSETVLAAVAEEELAECSEPCEGAS
ncbi:MAG TPA: MarR family winged helix-turn-helix transcriptional regulator [Acidimicrobiales bacterium]|nr:MarR family winged helix-turn-helix transcriptional regulator [Acidimicrobiales bacterium]